MYYLFTCILFFVSLFIYGQENIVLSRLYNEKLKGLPVKQRLFLHLNKTKYRDTDTIWFKGYSVQGPLQQASDISQTMIVALLNSKKEVVKSSQFLIFDGTAEGQIPISSSVGEGKFELVAYGSNMLNQPLDYMFRTSIEVVASKKNKYNFSFGFNRAFYKPDDQVEMQVFTYDKYYQPYQNMDFKYSIFDGDYKLDGGKMKSNDQGLSFLHFSYPSQQRSNLPLTIQFQTISAETPYRENTYALSLQQAIDVQLLPEGGDLVAGLMQIVAFRSVDDHGVPIDISGDIIDSQGTIVTSFNTAHQGMGKFMMIPNVGEKYRMLIKNPLDCAQKIEFPVVLEKGFALSYLGSQNENVIFKVAKNFDGVVDVTAVWQMDGFVLGTQSIKLDNEKMFSFSKKDLPNGIAKLTLFDKGGEPFAERLIFISPKSNAKVDLHLNAKTMVARGKGVVDLRVMSKDSLPVKANLSLAVTHISEGIHSFLPIPDIRDYCIFRSELSSAVYHPEQYFDVKVNEKLNEYRSDLLMLTHGWRKFNWYYELCHKLKADYAYYNYDLYRGMVTKGKKGVPYAPIDVLSLGRSITMSESKTDENGRFWIKPEFSEKLSPSIIISAERNNELSRVKISMEDKELEKRDSVVQFFYDELLPHVHRHKVDLYEKPGKTDSLFKLWDTKYIAEIFVMGNRSRNRLEESLRKYSAGSTYLLTEDDLGGELLDMESLVNQLGAGLYIENDRVIKPSGGKYISIPIVLNEIQLNDATFSEIAFLSSDLIEGIAYVKGGVVSSELDGAQDGALMIWTKKRK